MKIIPAVIIISMVGSMMAMTVTPNCTGFLTHSYQMAGVAGAIGLIQYQLMTGC